MLIENDVKDSPGYPAYCDSSADDVVILTGRKEREGASDIAKQEQQNDKPPGTEPTRSSDLFPSKTPTASKGDQTKGAALAGATRT